MYSHLVDNRVQLSRSIDPLILRRHKGRAFEAIAERAAQLCGPWGNVGDIKRSAKLTVLAGAAHLSLIADLMPIGNRLTLAYRKATHDITRAVMGQSWEKPTVDAGLIAFCDTITKPTLTARLHEIVADWSPDSALHAIRQHLRITPTDELPFSIQVIDAERDTPGNDYDEQSLRNEQKLAEFWTGDTPEAWVSPTDRGPVMFIRRSTVERLLEALSAGFIADNEVEVPLLGHEYAHTQRNFAFAGLPGLGHLWNEQLACGASRGLNSDRPKIRDETFYFEDGQYLDVISLMTDENLHLVLQEFAEQDDVDGFYCAVAQTVGLSGMSLLAAARPWNYGPAWALAGYHQGPQNAVVQTILEHRTRSLGESRVNLVMRKNMAEFVNIYTDFTNRERFDSALGFRFPTSFQQAFEHAKEQMNLSIEIRPAVREASTKTVRFELS